MVAGILERASAGPSRGYTAELLVAAELTAQGCVVGFASPSAPYDLFAERMDDHKVFRIQVKCAYIDARNRALFHTASVGRNRFGKTRHQYPADAFDVFAVVVPGEGVYFVPHDEFTNRSAQTVTDEIRGMTELPA